MLSSVGAAGAALLADALRVNVALTSLDLACNSIDHAGATQLAECLRDSNSTLKSLGLKRNHIGCEGATSMAEREHLADLDCIMVHAF